MPTAKDFMSCDRVRVRVRPAESPGSSGWYDADIKILDGLAAGGPWMAFKFLRGPWKGKRLVASQGCNCVMPNGKNPWTTHAVIDTRPQEDDGFKINGKDFPGARVPELDDYHMEVI